MSILSFVIAITSALLSVSHAADLVEVKPESTNSIYTTVSPIHTQSQSTTGNHDLNHIDPVEEKKMEPPSTGITSANTRGQKRNFDSYTAVDESSSLIAQAANVATLTFNSTDVVSFSPDTSSNASKTIRILPPSVMSLLSDEIILKIMKFLSNQDVCQLARTDCRFYAISGSEWFDRASALLDIMSPTQGHSLEIPLAGVSPVLKSPQEDTNFLSRAKKNIETLHTFWNDVRLGKYTDQATLNRRFSFKQYFKLLNDFNSSGEEFKRPLNVWFNKHLKCIPLNFRLNMALKWVNYDELSSEDQLTVMEDVLARTSILKFMTDHRSQIRQIHGTEGTFFIDQEWNFSGMVLACNCIASHGYSPSQLIDWENAVKGQWDHLFNIKNTAVHEVFFSACLYMGPDEIRSVSLEQVDNTLKVCSQYVPYTRTKIIAQLFQMNPRTLEYLEGKLGKILFQEWQFNEDEKVELLKIISTHTLEEIQRRFGYYCLYQENFEGRPNTYRAITNILAKGDQRYTAALENIARYNPSKIIPLNKLLLMSGEQMKALPELGSKQVDSWFNKVETDVAAAEALTLEILELTPYQIITLSMSCSDFFTSMSSFQQIEFFHRIRDFSPANISEMAGMFHHKNKRFSKLLTYLVHNAYEESGSDRSDDDDDGASSLTIASLPQNYIEMNQVKQQICEAIFGTFFPESSTQDAQAMQIEEPHSNLMMREE